MKNRRRRSRTVQDQRFNGESQLSRETFLRAKGLIGRGLNKAKTEEQSQAAVEADRERARRAGKKVKIISPAK